MRWSAYLSLLGLLAGCDTAIEVAAESPAADLALDDAGAEVDLGAPLACPKKIEPPGDSLWNLTVDGYLRSFYVHLPASYNGQQPTSLVFDFHGYTHTAVEQAVISGMNAKSDASGFIVVHPEGLQTSWNAGVCCGYAANTAVDDVKFARAMIDALEQRLCLDPKRIYATGFSNGALFSYRLACEAADRIAAVAPVAGVMGVTHCAPARPIAVLGFNGTADSIVMYNGTPLTFFPSVDDTISGWVVRDGCASTTVQSYAKGEVTCQTYGACAAGVAVTECTVQNGGHAWPGGTPIPTQHTTTDIIATDAIWDFFTAHPMP